MADNPTAYTLGASEEEQDRLEKQRVLYGDSSYLAFNPTDIVADIGCGAGANLWIATQIKKYIGIDQQQAQIDALNVKATQQHLNNIESYCAKAEALPLPDNIVDAAFTRLVLIHLDHPNNALREMYRIIKPGGKIICIEPEVRAYDASKPTLLKCFRARTEFTYRTHGTISVANELDQRLAAIGFHHIKKTQHDIAATGKNDREKLMGLFNNWCAMNHATKHLLLNNKVVTADDLAQAEREMNDLSDDDYIYQRLWVVEGIK